MRYSNETKSDGRNRANKSAANRIRWQITGSSNIFNDGTALVENVDIQVY